MQNNLTDEERDQYIANEINQNRCPFGMLDGPNSGVKSTAQSVALSPEVDANVWRGLFQVHAPRNVLFSQTLELRTETLRRLTPRIHIDRRISEREDA